ncbi:hypothetical protein PG996_010930 [Apiospora saccharicola]|uniref:Rhodopsin domain-containing protein n=1 Tax=Apiospora saccharicola TaxID=335842 RepID=A0ABR1UDL0_9PEZI
MKRSKKWAVVSLFAFGTLAPLASIARLAYQIVTADSEDKTEVYLMVGILANAEQVVGIIVGSLPVISSWAIQLKGRLGAAKVGLDATSRRFRQDWDKSWAAWKGRGRRQHVVKKDPYQITDAPTWTSQEMLYPSVLSERENEPITMKSLSSTV